MRSHRTVLPLAALGLLIAAPAFAQPRRRRPMPRRPAPPKKVDDEKKKEDETPKKPDRWFAVHAGWVHTVSAQGVLRDVTILAKNGKVVRIGADLELPEKCEVLDAKTKHVYPGLVAYNSFGIVSSSPQDSTDVFGLSMVMALSTGFTTVSSSGSIAKLTYGTLEDHYVGRKQTEIGINLRTAAARRRLRADFEKVRAHAREVRAYGVKKSKGEKVGKPPKPLSGKLSMYAKLMQGTGYASIRADTAADLRAAAQLGIDYGFRATITGGTEAHKVAPILGRAGFRVVVVPRNRPSPWVRTPRKLDWSIETPKKLKAAGVPMIIVPSSAGIGLWGLAGNDLFTITLEAAFAVRGGLTEAEALEAITLGPARFLGIDDQVGSIETGKDCDLVIAGGDLLHYEVLPEWTIVNGRIAYDKAKDSLLRHVRPRDLQKKNLELPQLWPRRKGTAEPEMPKEPKNEDGK